MDEKKITICYKCTNFLNLEPDSPRKDVWYNHLCKVNAALTMLDPVTGQHVTASGEDFRYCREINHGLCEQYEYQKTI